MNSKWSPPLVSQFIVLFLCSLEGRGGKERTRMSSELSSASFLISFHLLALQRGWIIKESNHWGIYYFLPTWILYRVLGQTQTTFPTLGYFSLVIHSWGLSICGDVYIWVCKRNLIHQRRTHSFFSSNRISCSPSARTSSWSDAG